MSPNLIPILVAVLLGILGVLGDFFIKLSGNGAKYISYPQFFIGMLIYALTAVGWFYVMKHIKLEQVGIFYSVTTVVFLVLTGFFFFKEQVSIYDAVGIILGIASLVILARFG